MTRKKIAFIDSTLRDGQETLLGGRLRLELVAPILRTLDEVGFQSIEAWGGGTFKSSLSRLHENPWERLRQLKKHLKRTPLQIFLRGRFLVGDRPFSAGFTTRFLKRSSELGAEVVRLVDPLNDFQTLADVAEIAKGQNLTTQGSILCSDLSPNLNNYRRLLRDSDLSHFDTIGIFDPFGILSAKSAGKLTQMLTDAGISNPFVHVHNLEGSAIAVTLRALEKGAGVIDTCFSAIEGNRSFPSIESLLRSLEGAPFASSLNVKPLLEVSKYLQRLYQENYAPIPTVMLPQNPVDEALQMMRPTSTMLIGDKTMRTASLKEDDVSSEMARIIEELELPGLLAPLSEILARQALLNLKSNSRYASLTDEFLGLVRGRYGKVKIPGMLAEYAGPMPENYNVESPLEESAVNLPLEGKLSEEDYLTFTLLPKEWSDLQRMRETSYLNQLRDVVPAALALGGEDQAMKSPPLQQTLGPKESRQYSHWRMTMRLQDRSWARKQGFLQEPC